MRYIDKGVQNSYRPGHGHEFTQRRCTQGIRCIEDVRPTRLATSHTPGPGRWTKTILISLVPHVVGGNDTLSAGLRKLYSVGRTEIEYVVLCKPNVSGHYALCQSISERAQEDALMESTSHARTLAYDPRRSPAIGQVQAPFETRPGEIPRRIQIERKRRLYSRHRVDALLRDRGIDYAHPQKSALAYLSEAIEPIPVAVRTRRQTD